MPQISPLATVSEKASIAPDVRLGAFACIGPEVRIASGCVIGSNVTIIGRTSLAQGCSVFPMAVIGTPGQGLTDGGECVIGEANTIREHATIYSGAGEHTEIGNDNLVMIGCIIGSGARIADHGVFDNCCHIGAGAVIGNYVRMSGFAAVAERMVVGDYAFITGYSSVDCHVPPYSRVQGCPIRVRGVNTTNLKRCGFGDDDVRAIKAAFRELFNGSNERVNVEALARLRREANPSVRRLVEAVEVSLKESR
jgi:UDP-N-acetylglucosamine acyltransferase